MRATVRNVSKIATTIASRNSEISDLLDASNNVTGILAQRNRQITTLLGDGAQLFAVINARRAAVQALLLQTVQLAQQLRGLVADNRATLGPALRSLAHVTDLLNRNKQNIDTILDRAGPVRRLARRVGVERAVLPGLRAEPHPSGRPRRPRHEPAEQALSKTGCENGTPKNGAHR